MVRCGRDEEEEERIVASCSEEKEEKKGNAVNFCIREWYDVFSVAHKPDKGKERTMVLNPRWHKERRSF